MMDSTHEALGKNIFYRKKTENKNKIYRRSIYSTRDINKNEIFTIKNIKRIRPSCGLSPEKFEFIIGRKAKRKISAGMPIKMSYIKI